MCQSCIESAGSLSFILPILYIHNIFRYAELALLITILSDTLYYLRMPPSVRIHFDSFKFGQALDLGSPRIGIVLCLVSGIRGKCSNHAPSKFFEWKIRKPVKPFQPNTKQQCTKSFKQFEPNESLDCAGCGIHHFSQGLWTD